MPRWAPLLRHLQMDLPETASPSRQATVPSARDGTQWGPRTQRKHQDHQENPAARTNPDPALSGQPQGLQPQGEQPAVVRAAFPPSPWSRPAPACGLLLRALAQPSEEASAPSPGDAVYSTGAL